jgi:serine/threonine protein kinase
MNVVKAILDRLIELTEVRKLEDLGGGGFGVVSKISRYPPILSTGDEEGVYAMKTVRDERLSDNHNRLCFFREIFTQILASHPAVVPIYGWNVFLQGNLTFCFVMPCYEKGTVHDWMGRLSSTQQLIIAYGIARGMRMLHSKFQIIHRDLKTENIFLDNEFRPFIADLGFAKVSADINQSAVGGTLRYMAPELFICMRNESSDYGLKVDVYAYGMICYELIEGALPRLAKTDCSDEKNLPRYSKAIIEGKRPPIKNATAEQISFLEELWAGEPQIRPSFRKVCVELEGNVGLFPGANREEFEEYKTYLDKGEIEAHRQLSQIGDENIVLPDWTIAASEEGSISRKLWFDIVSAAIDGNREAQKCASVLYLAGVGLNRSRLQATRFALSSDDGILGLLGKVGSDIDYVEIGEIYEGRELFEEASKYYRQAAERGSVRGLWRWGTILVYNDTGLQTEEGIRLLKAADASGSADAAFELGRLYIEGIYVAQDEANGVRYIERSAELGHADAAFYLGRYYHARFDVKNARRWYTEADSFEPVRVETEDGTELVGNQEAHKVLSLLEHLWIPDADL